MPPLLWSSPKESCGPKICYYPRHMDLDKRQTTSFKELVATYFKEVIYGGIDGIVTTFAVVAGFAGAALSGDDTLQLSFFVVLLFGLANLFADAASMGLGNFLSVRSEKDLYKVVRKSEQETIKTDEAEQVATTINLLKSSGFSEEQASVLAHTYKHNEEYWLDFIMHHKQEMTDPRGENEMFTGFATFVSFIVFGSIPLIPFMFVWGGDAATTFKFSAIGTFLALIALGLLKWKVVGANIRASLFEVVAVGGTAAVLAYLVGTFFAL